MCSKWLSFNELTDISRKRSYNSIIAYCCPLKLFKHKRYWRTAIGKNSSYPPLKRLLVSLSVPLR